MVELTRSVTGATMDDLQMWQILTVWPKSNTTRWLSIHLVCPSVY